jgi:hypothetical protein
VRLCKMKFSEFDKERFIQQRKELFKLINREITLDGHHKSYEGQMELCFSDAFEIDNDDDPTVVISLHCYLAPINGRHETFMSQDDLEILLQKWDKSLCEQEREFVLS